MSRLPFPAWRRRQGFTLIEVMIVVAIIALLAAIAMPSYEAYVRRTHRGNARTALLQAAQWMERAATARGRYPAAADVPATLLTVEGGRYTLSFDGSTGLTPTTFTLLATPQSGQASDACGIYALTNNGQREQRASSSVTTPDSVALCWDR